MTKIPNIGPKSQTLLDEIEVFDLVDLQALGSVEVYARLKFRFGRQANRNFLHALDAAILGCSWKALPPERKVWLDMAVEKRLAQIPH